MTTIPGAPVAGLPGRDPALDSLARVAARLLAAPAAAVLRVTPQGIAAAGATDDATLAAVAHEAAELASSAAQGPFAEDDPEGPLPALAVALAGDVLVAVADVHPREWSTADAGTLLDVARAAWHEPTPAAGAGAAEAPAAPLERGSWTWDLESDSITWTEEVNRILGLPRGQLVVGTHPFLQLVHPDDRVLLRETMRAAVRERRDFELQHRIVRPSGVVRRVRTAGRLADPGDEAGATFFVGTFEDVTAANAPARAAGESERRSTLLTAVIETMREIARTEFDVEAMTSRIAERAMALTHADGAAIGMLEGDAVLYRGVAGLDEPFAGALIGLGDSLTGYCVESGDVVRCDDTSRDPRVTGELAYVRDIRSMVLVPLAFRRETVGVLAVTSRRPSAFGDDDGHLLQLMAGVSAGLIAHAAAYEAQRVALGQLRETHELLSLVVEASPLAIVTMAPDFTVTMWNPAAERLFGWPAEEVVGHPLPTVPEDEELPTGMQRLALANGHTGTEAYEARRRRRDGTLVDVQVAAGTLRDPAGQPRGILAIYTDIAERKRLEARLRQAQRMEAVGQLAGGIAHDFNNLLTIMQLHAEALMEELPPEDPLHEDATEIQRQTERAASLTRQLLAFSRKQLLQPRLLDLNATVRDVEKMLRRVIGEDIALETALDPTAGRVVADPNQLMQVLLNLSVNARDAMPDGGRLTIRTEDVWLDDGYGDRHGAVVPEGPYVMLAVGDTGAGMDRATQARIFEPFFTTKEPGRGTGLGLATVYGIVKQSGGYVWCYSEPGLGSTFKVYLPRMNEEPAPAPEAPEEERGGTETILLVEDDPDLRELARQHLVQLGYLVLVGEGGEDAVRQGAEHAGPLHLLITDVVLPGLSGGAIAEQLRALRPDVRVLFMSGYTDDDIVRRGLLAPRQAMLQKPFSRRALAAAVRRALES